MAMMELSWILIEIMRGRGGRGADEVDDEGQRRRTGERLLIWQLALQ
jgi:hypothetical protein